MDRMLCLAMVVCAVLSSASGCQEQSPVVAIPDRQPVIPEREQEVARFEIVDEMGNVVLSDKQIVGYEWRTHKIFLKPGTDLKPTVKEGHSIVHGVPFTIRANGVTCYQGKFTVSESSFSQSCPIINLTRLFFEAEEGTVRIELGYPGEKYFKGEDPRSDERIRKAFKALQKLRE